LTDDFPLAQSFVVISAEAGLWAGSAGSLDSLPDSSKDSGAPEFA
jgi:hypothetical protein